MSKCVCGNNISVLGWQRNEEHVHVWRANESRLWLAGAPYATDDTFRIGRLELLEEMSHDEIHPDEDDEDD